MERSSFDDVVEALAKEVDGTLIEANLKLTPTERIERMRSFLEFIEAVRPVHGGKHGRVPEAD
jgi:hypothetical protein